MRNQWPLQDAQDNFSEVVSATTGEMPQAIAKRQQAENGFASFLLSIPTNNGETAALTSHTPVEVEKGVKHLHKMRALPLS